MKRILLFTPDTFGYYQKIVGEYQNLGYVVDWHNIVPDGKIWFRILFRLLPSLGASLGSILHGRSIKWDEEYTDIFVVKGEGINKQLVRRMKARWPNAQVTFYSWDSFRNNRNGEKIFSLFDKAYSFDFEDVANYDRLEYRALFYSGDTVASGPSVYSAFFVGTLHSDRFLRIKELAKKIEVISGKESFVYFYYPNKFVYIIKSLFSSEMRKAYKDVHFESLTGETYLDLMSKSDIVLDIVHKDQSGLTMRTIETLGAGKKLLTNNKKLVEDDKLPVGEYFILDTSLEFSSFDVQLEKFVKSSQISKNEYLLHDYSIKEWCKFFVAPGKTN